TDGPGPLARSPVEPPPSPPPSPPGDCARSGISPFVAEAPHAATKRKATVRHMAGVDSDLSYVSSPVVTGRPPGAYTDQAPRQGLAIRLHRFGTIAIARVLPGLAPLEEASGHQLLEVVGDGGLRHGAAPAQHGAGDLARLGRHLEDLQTLRIGQRLGDANERL